MQAIHLLPLQPPAEQRRSYPCTPAAVTNCAYLAKHHMQNDALRSSNQQQEQLRLDSGRACATILCESLVSDLTSQSRPRVHEYDPFSAPQAFSSLTILIRLTKSCSPVLRLSRNRCMPAALTYLATPLHVARHCIAESQASCRKMLRQPSVSVLGSTTQCKAESCTRSIP
jgi:hypothetical protein